MTVSSYFSSTYQEARARFTSAAEEAGARLRSHANPTPGMAGEDLSCDTAFLGDPEAEAVLVTISATHGVEGFCGSGVQVGWFESGLAAEMPAGVALLAVHAINPYGFSWLRRVTEENVDLNRNFIDFTAPRPENPGYDELAPAIELANWDEASLAAASTR